MFRELVTQSNLRKDVCRYLELQLLKQQMLMLGEWWPGGGQALFGAEAAQPPSWGLMF